MAFLLMFSLQCLFPIFESSRVDEFLGVSIVNRESQDRTFTVTATVPEGTSAQTGRVSIPAGGQRAQLINEILGTPRRPASGWISIDSSDTRCTSYVTSGNESMLDSADPAATTSTSILIPNVSVFTGFVELNHIDTYLALVNPGRSSAAVTARLFGLDGVNPGSTVISVPAGGSRTVAISEAFRDVLPDNRLGGKAFQGYVRLSSTEPIAAWARGETPLSRKLGRGWTAEEVRPTTLAIVPHFAIGAAYESILNLVNPTAGTLALDLEARDDRGNVMGKPVRVILAPGQVQRSSVIELFAIDNLASAQTVLSGYIRIREAQGGSMQIVGDIEIITHAFDSLGSSVLYPISESPATDWLIPFATSTGSWFTGFAIANPNDLLTVQTDVQIEVLNSAATLIERSTISLSPRNRQASLVAVGVPSGYLRITSNMPVHVVGSIGTRDGRLLDQLPALR